MKGSVEADAGESSTEICEKKQRKTSMPGNTYEKSTREEKVETEKTKFRVSASNKTLEDESSESSTKEVSNCTKGPHEVDCLMGNPNIFSEERLGGAKNTIRQTHGDAAQQDGGEQDGEEQVFFGNSCLTKLNRFLVCVLCC